MIELLLIITAFIHFDEQAIVNDGDLGNAYFVVDGQEYEGYEYDMSDWVYGSDPIIEKNLFTKEHPKELVVPDNTTQICLTDDVSYYTCLNLRDKDTEVHFVYPASYPGPASP